MQISDLCIRRPVFATVLSLLLIVAGFAGLGRLPVREYPAIDPPIVSVSTVYKGASNEVIENRITEVVESSIAGIEGIRNITSSSQDERSNVSIEFNVNRDPDAAASDVRDRVSRILARLPDGVDAPVVRRVDANAQAIIWIAVQAPSMDALELTDFLKRVVVDRLSTVDGVASVSIGGERRYAMRIFLDRGALAARGLTAQDVEAAIKRQNVDLPGGRLTSSQRELTVKTESRLADPESFRAIVVSNRNGYLVRLGEVARVEVGAEDDRFEFYSSGTTAIGLGVVRQSTANTLSVADGVLAEIAKLREALPPGGTMDVLYNEATFIRASIDGVLRTLLEGIALVVLVILVFLRSWRSTLVAVIAIPVSIIPTFLVLAFFGFSINVLTLLAVVLAIGIVVDDAIVEVENIHRRIEEGEPALLASFDGAREIGFAVIATTITLMTVFIPISFMDGQTGKLFREFGITLAAAIGFSGVVARTLTPMLCSKLLIAEHGLIHRWTEPLFEGLNSGYRRLLRGALAAPIVVLALGGAVSFAAYGLFQAVPKEFAPVEDRGTVLIPITAPEGSSLAYTRARVREVEGFLKPYQDQGVIDSVLSIVAPGYQRPSPVNTGLVIVRLKPWEERTLPQQDLVRRLLGPVAGLPGARAFPVNPGSLGQRGTQQPVQFVLGGPDYPTLRDWRDRVLQRATASGLFVNLDSDFREAQPDLRVAIDRPRAADLGVSIEVIGRTLELMFGEREVSTYVDRGVEYPVIVQARATDRGTPQDLKNVFVRATSGDLVPLSSFVKLTEVAGPQQLNRFDRLRSITIQASLAPGTSLGQGLDAMERIAAEVLPPEVRIGYAGQSKEFKQTSNSLYITFGVALVVVFLVLAGQFESWIAPSVIMLAVPLAITGGLAALLLTGQSLNVYSQIGMVILIGIMTKNGILIVEFTNQMRERGLPVREALMEAAVQRLRPILMTSIATIFGAVPLALSHGAGAEARSAIGWVVVGGSTLSTFMTLFVVPALYLLLGGYAKPRNHVGELLDKLRGGEAHAPAAPPVVPAE